MANLCAGIVSAPCPGWGGSFAVESAAAFAWNRWQVYYGISGSFRVERVAALPWNQWQDSPGIGGSFAVEYATERAWGPGHPRPAAPLLGTGGRVVGCHRALVVPSAVYVAQDGRVFVAFR